MPSGVAEIRGRLAQQRQDFAVFEQRRRELSHQVRSQMEQQQQQQQQQPGARGSVLPRHSGTVLALLCIAAAVVVPLYALLPQVFVVRSQLHALWCESRGLVGLSSGEEAQHLAALREIERSPHPFGSEVHNKTLFWGTYAHDLLAGVRSRDPQGVVVGLAWYDNRHMFPVRHRVTGAPVTWRWDVHDGRFYGRRTVEDRELSLRLTVQFVKRPDGRAWSLRIAGHRWSSEPITLCLYVASEAPLPVGILSVSTPSGEQSNVAPRGLEPGAFAVGPTVSVSGRIAADGRRFRADVTDLLAGTGASQWRVHGQAHPTLDVRRPGSLLQEHRLFMRPAPRVSMVTLRRSVAAGFALEVALAEQETQADPVAFADGCTVLRLARAREEVFERRLDSVFDVRRSAAAAAHSLGVPARAVVDTARRALATLLGSIAYVPPGAGSPPRFGVVEPGEGPHLWRDGLYAALLAPWDDAVAKDIVSAGLDAARAAGDPTGLPAVVEVVRAFADRPRDDFVPAVLPELQRWAVALLRNCTDGACAWPAAHAHPGYPRSEGAAGHLDLFCTTVRVAAVVRDLETHAASAGVGTPPRQRGDEEWGALLDRTFWASDRYADATGGAGPYFGAVSLAPIVTSTARDRGHVAALLQSTRRELLGAAGLQSLSNASRKAMPYTAEASGSEWTGAVPLPLNYAVLRALATTYADVPEAAELYELTRRAVLATAVAAHAEASSLYGVYDPFAAASRGSSASPASGLLVAILAGRY